MFEIFKKLLTKPLTEKKKKKKIKQRAFTQALLLLFNQKQNECERLKTYREDIPKQGIIS